MNELVMELKSKAERLLVIFLLAVGVSMHFGAAAFSEELSSADCHMMLIRFSESAQPREISFREAVERTPDFLIQHPRGPELWTQLDDEAQVMRESLPHFIGFFRSLMSFSIDLAPHLKRENEKPIEDWKLETTSDDPYLRVSENLEIVLYMVNQFNPFLGRILADKMLEALPDLDSDFITDSYLLQLWRSSNFLQDSRTFAFLEMYPLHRFYSWKKLFQLLEYRPWITDQNLFDFLLSELDESIRLSEVETEQSGSQLMRQNFGPPIFGLDSGSDLLWARLERLDVAEDIARLAKRFYKKHRMQREVRILDQRILDLVVRQKDLLEADE